MKLYAPLLGVLVGCAAAPIPPVVTAVPEIPGNWCEGAVTIAVSDEFEDDCLENIATAIEFWRGVGVDYMTTGLVPKDEMLFDQPVHGVLQVFAASYLGEEVLGQCVRLSDDKTGCTKAAQIELVACDVQTVAHEIGHALGLPHVESERNLMFPYSTGRMGLDAAQRASVTQ